MKKLQQFVLVAMTMFLPALISPVAGAATTEDAESSLSLGGLLIYDRDFAHNADPFKLTNETTVTVELIGLKGSIKSVYLAENDSLTSNAQIHYRRPVGDYDGGTTVSFTLTPQNGKKTIWAIVQDKTNITYPPTSGTLTLDTIPPHFQLDVQSRSNRELVATVTFSEDVHGFDENAVAIGGAGGTIKQFSGKGAQYEFVVVPVNPSNVKIELLTDRIWDLAGNAATEADAVHLASATAVFVLPSLTVVGSTECSILDNGEQMFDDFLESTDRWVDFYWTGLSRDGTESNPYNNLSEAALNATAGDTVKIKPGASPERLRITKPLRIEASGGSAQIGGAGVMASGGTLRWYDAGGTVLAWLDASGCLYIAGTLHQACNPIPSGSYIWTVTSGGVVYAALSDSGDLYLRGNFQFGSVTGNVIFSIADPDDAETNLLAVSDQGNMGAHGLWLSCSLTGGETLPANITVQSVSPLFPTPNYSWDLPSRYRDFLSNDAILTSDAMRKAISPMEILSMFIWTPNMHWSETTDGFLGAAPYHYPNPGMLRARIVNTTAGDWGRPTFNPAGNMYVLGSDGRGYQSGFSIFNRYTYNYDNVFWDDASAPNTSFNRLAGFAPGHYDGTRNDSEHKKGKILAWYPRLKKMNVFDFNNTDINALRVAWNHQTSNQLWLDGDLYYAFFEKPRVPSGSDEAQRDDCYRTANAGIIRIKNIDSWKSNDEYTSSLTTASGQEWEEDTNHGLSVIDPALNAEGWHNYVSLHSGDGAGNFPAFPEDIGGQLWNYDGAQWYGTGQHKYFMWQNRKFCSPTFVQFGPGYVDYVEPDSVAATTMTTNQRYIYAVSSHNAIWGEDALYLGRCLVTLKGGSGSDAQWHAWEYYIGSGIDGQPLWSTDVDLAKSILYGESEMGHPSVIYEPNTQLYVMAAFTNNHNINSTSVNHHYSIYVARRPWGPWRKVFTNDYNGFAYRPAQDMRNQEGSAYDVQLWTNPIEPQSGFNYTNRTGSVRLWLSFGGQLAFMPNIVLGRTGALLASTDWCCVDGGQYCPHRIAPWDEYFKQVYYTFCFQEIQLNVGTDGEVSSAVPAVAQQTYPEYRMEGQYHYDHWGWRPTFDASGAVVSATFSLDPKWFGYRFTVGPHDIGLSELGRFYMSGNTRPHKVCIFRPADANPVKVETTIQPGSGGAQAGMFTPPSASANGTRLGGDGYLYHAVDATTLTANTEYYILSREGIDQTDTESAHALERVVAVPQPVEYTGSTIYAGYRFRTGPLGLRVTKLYRVSLSGDQSRDVVIEKADTQIVNGDQEITFYSDIYEPYSRSIDTSTRILSETIPISGSNLENIGELDFYTKELETPIDLEPMTDYYIGVQVLNGDYLSSATTYADSMAKMHFNPNAFQFFHPARMENLSAHRWISISHAKLPSIDDGQPYNDGIGLSPAVEYPVFFDFIVPDRFEGYRSQVGTGKRINQVWMMDRGKNKSSHVTMPLIKHLNTANNLNLNIKVVNAAMSERQGSYQTNQTLFANTDWTEKSAGEPVFHAFGAPNSTFGPLDLIFKGTDASFYNLVGDGVFTSPPEVANTYYNASDFTKDASEQEQYLKVDPYENNGFVKPTISPWPSLFDQENGFSGIYSGMQIKVMDHDTSLTKVGRYFPSGLVADTIHSHDVVIVRARDKFLMGVGTFSNGDYNANEGKFIYASITKPGESTPVGITLRRGDYYFIGVWDYKGLDRAENITNRQFGLIEDYSRMKTSSSIIIRGPAMADDNAGIPTNITPFWLESPTDRLSQGFGPLNMTYTSGEPIKTLLQATPASHSNAYTGYVGIDIKTGNNPVMVTHLGRYKITSPANANTHQMVILRKNTGVSDATGKPSEVVASCTVNGGGQADADGFVYEKLQNPVVLEPNTEYIVASYEKAGGDHYLTVGSYAQTSSTFWSSVDILSGCAMNPENGTLTQITLTPNVNLKAQ